METILPIYLVSYVERNHSKISPDTKYCPRSCALAFSLGRSLCETVAIKNVCIMTEQNYHNRSMMNALQRRSGLRHRHLFSVTLVHLCVLINKNPSSQSGPCRGRQSCTFGTFVHMPGTRCSKSIVVEKVSEHINRPGTLHQVERLVLQTCRWRVFQIVPACFRVKLEEKRAQSHAFLAFATPALVSALASL